MCAMFLTLTSLSLFFFFFSARVRHLPRFAMASINPQSIISDHIYSLDDRLKRGRPPPLLENACEDAVFGEEPALETTPVIDPASKSTCCIEKSSFPTVPLFFSVSMWHQ